MTTGEVAEALGIHVNTVIAYMEQGRFNEPIRPRRLIGGHRRIHKDSVARLKTELEAGDSRDD